MELGASAQGKFDGRLINALPGFGGKRLEAVLIFVEFDQRGYNYPIELRVFIQREMIGIGNPEHVVDGDAQRVFGFLRHRRAGGEQRGRRDANSQNKFLGHDIRTNVLVY